MCYILSINSHIQNAYEMLILCTAFIYVMLTLDFRLGNYFRTISASDLYSRAQRINCDLPFLI